MYGTRVLSTQDGVRIRHVLTKCVNHKMNHFEKQDMRQRRKQVIPLQREDAEINGRCLRDFSPTVMGLKRYFGPHRGNQEKNLSIWVENPCG